MRKLIGCIGLWEIWNWKQEVGTGEYTEMTEKKDLLAGEVVTKLGHISPIPINTRFVHIHGSTQIQIQYPRKSDSPGMPPWTLWAEPYVKLLGCHFLGVAKSDMTRELDMTNPFINKSWVEAKRVRVIFELTRLTCLLNGSCSCLTCLTCLTRLAYKGNFTILPL